MGANIHRREFGKVKDNLIKQWETETGQQWPKYKENMVSKKGNNLDKIGKPFDAHEIVPNSHGGPLEWWNITPARFPDQHQAGIHGADSVLNKIINNK